MDYDILRSHVLHRLRTAGIVTGDHKGRLSKNEENLLDNLLYKLLKDHPPEHHPFYDFSQRVHDIAIREYESLTEENIEKAREKIRKNPNHLFTYCSTTIFNVPAATPESAPS